MEEEIEDFIKTWNDNIEKINGYSHTHNSLAIFCISTIKQAYKNFSLKKLIINLNNREEDYKEKIKSFQQLNTEIQFQYHKEKINNNKSDRKFIYNRQENRGNEIVFDRVLEINESNINIKKITQKEIDFAITNEYVSEKKTDYFDGFIGNTYSKEEFIFYQINLYNRSTFRIKKWYDILKKIISQEKNFDIKYLNFLSKLYLFFKDYNQLDSEQEKLELWFNKLKIDNNFNIFLEYFISKNTNEFNENLIKLFKEDYFKKLDKSFNLNLKKSISKDEFLKIQIKEFKKQLNKPPDDTWSYRRKHHHNDVYDDLIKGNRENYYNNVDLSRVAGETEAILDFITYLEGRTITLKKNEAIRKNTTIQHDLLPIEIFDNTRNYLKKNAQQVNICYRYKAYDACFILLRKITETLIIEFYEKEEIEDKIKDEDNNYFMLKKLISSIQNERKFKKINSRSINEILPRIKKNGDLSAHKRKFNARKLDVDRLRDDYRIIFEEFIHSIFH